MIGHADDHHFVLELGLLAQGLVDQDATLGVDLDAVAFAIDVEHEVTDIGTEMDGAFFGDSRKSGPDLQGVDMNRIIRE